MENEPLKKSKTQKDRFLQSLNLAEINKNNNNYESIFDYCKNRKNSVVAKISNHFSNKKAKKKYTPIISEDAYIVISSDDDIGLDFKKNNNNNVISQPLLSPEPIQNNNIPVTNQSQLLTTANNTEEETETELLQNNNNPIEPVQTSSLDIPNQTKNIKILHRVSISSLESSLADEHISQLVSNKPVSLNDFNSSSSDSDDNDDDRLVSFKNKWCVCDKVISTLNDKKMCDCGQWYHLSCLGYSKEESERFNDKKTDENLKFICPVCKNDQNFIQKYKQVIEFRKKKYFTQRSSSSNEEDDDDDDDDDDEEDEDEEEEEEDEYYDNKNQMSCSESESSSSEYNLDSRKRSNFNSNKKVNLVNSVKKKPMVSELSEKDQRDKIEKLIKSQKQPNQTRLIDNPKSFKRKLIDSSISNKPSSSKLVGLTSQKSLIDKLTTKKEQSKMATNNNKSCKQCLACKKSFLMNRSVPNKIVQEQFLETSDKLQLNWRFSLYCDEKCINKYIEIKLNEREKYLAEKSPIKNDLTDESKRTHIFLYDNNNNHSFINVNKKSNEDVKKEIYRKISVQPKFYIVDLNNLQELLNENKIKLPDQIKIFKKVTIFQPQTNNNNISKTVDSNLNNHKVLRSISTPEPPSTVSTVSNSKTSVNHESGAGDERSVFRNGLLKSFKSRLDTDSDLNISDSLLNDLIGKIEMAFYNHFVKDKNKGYRQKFVKLCLNINEKKNNFYSKILTGKILPEQLPTITADEMNEEKAKERKTEEEVNLKQIKLGSEEINYSILHRLKKTHKGEIEIENTFDISESLINQNLEKSDGDMSKNNGCSSMAASTTSNEPTSTASTLSSSLFYNRTLSMPVVDNNNQNMLTLNKKTVEQASKRTLSTESNENTNSKRPRHDPNFESDEEEDDDESTASKIIINSSSLIPLKPIIELNTTSSKRPSIDNSSNDINIPEIFNLNSNYIAPHSPPLLPTPPITATQTSSKPNWSGQLFLKSSDYKTCVHAKLIQTIDQDSPAQAFEKLLINSLISLKIEFNFIKKQKNFHKSLTFYNYLKKIKNDLNGLAFLEITSNGLEKNSLSYGHADKSEFILMEDKASFFHFKNNFLKDVEESNIIAYEYKIPDELDKFIGHFYVLVLKKKLEDNSKWFPENLSIPLDRKEDVVLGVFIDKKCKNYQQEAFIHHHSSKNSPTGNVVNESEKQQQQQQIQPLTDNGGSKPKPKLDQLNSTAISSNKSHVDSNKPNNNVNRDPRLERQRSKQVDSNQNKACTETPTQKSIDTTKTTEQSNIQQPILKDIRIVEESTVSQKPNNNNNNNIEQPTSTPTPTTTTTTGYQELDSNPERSHFFNHIEKTLNNLDKNNLDLIQFELMSLTLFENITTSTEKQILLERYSKDFPAFEVMIRAAKEYMPPNETWQGKSKEAFENLIDLHKKNAENKCYHNFTFHNEEWNLINSDSFKIPKIDFENNKSNDNIAEKRSFTNSNNFNKQASHFQHQSRNNSHFNQNNYNKNNHQFRRKSTSQTRDKDRATVQNSKIDL